MVRTTACAQYTPLLAEALGAPFAVHIGLPPDTIEQVLYKLYAFVQYEGLSLCWHRDRILFEITEASYPASTVFSSEIHREQCFQGAGLA